MNEQEARTKTKQLLESKEEEDPLTQLWEQYSEDNAKKKESD